MTPEEWNAYYEALKASFRRDAIHDILNGMFRRAEPFEHSTWTTDHGSDWKAGSGDEFSPGAGLDIVKIVYETRFSEGIKIPYHGSSGAMRCYAEMWRGEQNVREPINVGKMEEFVAELKDEGFKEIRRQDCLHYLWRKRT